MEKKICVDINGKSERYEVIIEENKKIKNLLQKSYDALVDIKNEISIMENNYKTAIQENNTLEKRTKEDLNQILQLESKLIEVNNLQEIMKIRNKELQDRVDALRNSKLGKINVAYWKFKNRFKESKNGGY